ncbi:MAG: DNA and RNA helicase [Paenibacillus dendritiformis]|uniref:DNA and RNA helicase n=1 Tax=uncultured Paenibacillus sp. TaxID=227322 RepID=UPI0025D38525|nr:DNA and RNA helicase [uncultured Paenibacillus sp.]MDU5145477.1 DNA and RNA helicase [Paenibacillus dendritiformis]
MFKHQVPHFHRGRILKTDMLENLRDFPRQFVDIAYQSYSSGVLAGTEVRVGPRSLTVGKGIVKHGGLIYMLEQEHELPYRSTGRETVLKIRFHAEQPSSDFTTLPGEIVLDENTAEVKANEMELGRFKLKEGARLRDDYQSFADLSTEFNTLNVIHVPHAGIGQSTLSPFILRYFAQELLKTRIEHAQDAAFAMLCLNGGAVERDVIQHYLGQRLGTGYRELTNERLYAGLRRVLSEAGSGRAMAPDMRSGGRQRVIVD